MRTDHFEHHLDLRRGDIDPEIFSAALAVKYIRTLITNGGGEFSRLDWDSLLHPDHLQIFLSRAVEMAQKTKHFEREWRNFQQILPHMKQAWEKGQALFQDALSRAATNEEGTEYLSQIDFAVDCYAYVSARNAYPNNQALQAWAINGYMLAWGQHFLDEEDGVS